MKLTYRKDYIAPAYRILTTNLDFTLDEEKTIVKNTMKIEKIKDADLVLNGVRMKLLDIAVDGKKLTKKEYKLTEKSLTLKNLPSSFILDIQTQINPKANTYLSGLYMSNGVFTTQCEPEGFRAITYFMDHPDVLSTYTVTIHANRKKYPVLLSNGNKIKDTGNTVVWHDPFPKPSYLFALVAGDLGHIEDSFVTCSGKKVDLRIYCEKGKESRLYYAMDSLKRAMRWDEKTFGREYDLNLFNIVAVPDFNAGAMENKSLNIFNDSCLLADEKTATDATYEFVEGVVAHEYFHNWSGDRVTARDWFNLSLKEGFTVYRDEEFSSDMRSRVVKRMDDVSYLKLNQFPSDDGPLKHPVRPDSFATIENFYTTTVYEKGAELIRMQEKIVGKKGFRKATDLYFSRHDGQAVTIDDFVKCVEDANKINLKPFMNWYSVAGRPTVSVEKEYNNKTKTYKIKLKQNIKDSDAVFMIPLSIGLIGKDGKDIVSETIIFNKKEQTFTFKNIKECPGMSINRNFTAPITLNVTYTDEESLFLMKNDNDLFNRYEVGQEYALSEILKELKNDNPKVSSTLIDAYSSYLDTASKDPAFTARAIIFPAASYIGDKMETFEVDKVLDFRKQLRIAFAKQNATKLKKIYDKFNTNEAFNSDAKQAGKRALKNAALGYLSLLPEYADLAKVQYQNSKNMTDRRASFSALVHNRPPFAKKALADFYKMFKKDALVINRWLALQASVEDKETIENVIALAKTKDFVITNPNKVRSLIGVFGRNLKAFHTPDGKGYHLLADYVIQLNAINPQIAEGIIHPLCDWKRFDKKRQKLMKAELNRIAKIPNLSVNLNETITKALA
ncbi:MAG: aminopeptidase N [Alphaproteobacteria bacterium]|nr:aminopeptidase N [Alphaproteobacteria bacterium]